MGGSGTITSSGGRSNFSDIREGIFNGVRVGVGGLIAVVAYLIGAVVSWVVGIGHGKGVFEREHKGMRLTICFRNSRSK